ncbi:MAG: ribonuclease P protein component [Desulfobaccales bacterium]
MTLTRVFKPSGQAGSRDRASAPLKTGRFTFEQRLRRRQEYLRVQARGKKLHTPHFGICLAPGEGKGPRLGLVVGRKVGPATRRNRVKRLLREFFRRHQNRLPDREIIIMAKKGASELSYEQATAELATILLPRPRPEHHD